MALLLLLDLRGFGVQASEPARRKASLVVGRTAPFEFSVGLGPDGLLLLDLLQTLNAVNGHVGCATEMGATIYLYGALPSKRVTLLVGLHPAMT